jgi:hypothetical protein
LISDVIGLAIKEIPTVRVPIFRHV